MNLIKKYWRELALVLIVLAIAIGAVWKLNNPSDNAPLPFPIPTPTADQPVDVLYIRSDQFLEAQGALRKGGPISEAYLMEHIHAKWAKNIVALWDDAYSTCGIGSVSTH